MKKTMFVAAAAVAASCFADVTSANIVGYQDIVVPNGYSMFTVTFKDPANTVYDVRDIVILNADGYVMDDTQPTGETTRRSRNKIVIQKMNPMTGGLYTDHNYRFSTQSGKGWCDGSTSLTAGQLTFADGEGFAVTSTQGENVKFRVRGEVVLTPVSMAIPNGFSLIGNMTPNTVDVTEIKILNSAGLEMNDDKTVTPSRQSRNKVVIQKMNPTTGGLFSDHNYRYSTQNGKGWCDGSTSLTAGQLTLAPGETVAVSSTQGDTVYFQFPTPVSE